MNRVSAERRTGMIVLILATRPKSPWGLYEGRRNPPRLLPFWTVLEALRYLLAIVYLGRYGPRITLYRFTCYLPEGLDD